MKRIKLVRVSEERKAEIEAVIAEGRRLFPGLDGADLAARLPLPYRSEALTLLLAGR
jgi:hypothetical protein